VPVNVVGFEELIEDGLLYVDKTAYLASMIAWKGIKAWFVSRPRRFGKSLTVSTFKAIFSGRRELFKGLAMEGRLDDERFAPRQVISLDMSAVTTEPDAAGFERSLRLLIAERARSLDVDIPSDLQSSDMIGALVEKCALNPGPRVAVLIDEYDSPIIEALDNPQEIKAVRKILRAFYKKLKALQEKISFTFVTGVCKFSRLGVFSAPNNLFDASLMPEFGAMLGFTHEELLANFGGHLRATAHSLKMGQREFIERLRTYYDGFCFDGRTSLYNPFSTALLLVNKEFGDYWFDSGTSAVIARYVKDNNLVVEEFRGLSVDQGFAREPGEIDQTGPASFLYQSGYLSLRRDESEGGYILDYPNLEVLRAMSRLMTESVLGDRQEAMGLTRAALAALAESDVDGTVRSFNRLLSGLAYDDIAKANRQKAEALFPGLHFGEWLYRSTIRSFLIGAGLRVEAETHGNLGRSDLVVHHRERVWVFELKVTPEGKTDENTAKTALRQALEKNYGGRFDKPIVVGLAVSEAKRSIAAWVSQIGPPPANQAKAASKAPKGPRGPRM
jgi:hypothetical protein